MKPINVGVIGAGGFAAHHIDSVKYCESLGTARLQAVVIRPQDYASVQETAEELQDRGVRMYESAEAMFQAEKGRLDLVTVPVGIHLHAPLSIAAMRAGFHVLCEKPIAGTTAEALEMKRAGETTGKMLAIGYQNIAAPSVRKIKRITTEGTLGKLRSAAGVVRWPRWARYYRRNEWAGKIEVQGKRLYDSPLQNATNHYFNIMLYIAGDGPREFGRPAEVYGENYRAKNIESADTQFLRVKTDAGVVLHYAATHAVKETLHPKIDFEYERGLVRWGRFDAEGEETSDFFAHIYRRDGDELEYVESHGNGDCDVHRNSFRKLIEAMQNGEPPLCTIDNTYPMVACVESSFASSGGVTAIPAEFVENADAENGYDAYVKDIQSIMESMFTERKSFVEIGCGWGVQGKPVAVTL
ncbi:MAG: Gfo/Idh/MocA family oxidoreductase [Phycisphaerae bacterium]|nr:Gfo/Idh/MocA family oxidoreductase [Phycisphaerae bacterium]